MFSAESLYLISNFGLSDICYDSKYGVKHSAELG